MRRAAFVLFFAAAAMLPTLPALGQVAVFAQPGFPAAGATRLPPPAAIVARLRALGIAASAVDGDALADPTRFNERAFVVLVLPYGHTFPRDAFPNLLSFHRAGGCLVLTGVPFNHAVVRQRSAAAGWKTQPGWGDAIRVVPNGKSGMPPAHGGRFALALTGPEKDWAGLSSRRFPVSPNQRLAVSGWFTNVSGLDRGDDHLFVGFFNKAGEFIGSARFPLLRGDGWQHVAGEAIVPADAAAADVSPQLRSPGRAVLLDDLAVFAGGVGPNLVENGGFEDAGDQWTDVGWDAGAAGHGPEGIGVGMPGGPTADAAIFRIAPGDPLGLRPSGLDWSQNPEPYWWLDPGSLPEEDVILPILGTRLRPSAALIVHHCADYPGAIDVWAHQGPNGDKALLGAGQIIVRSVITVLARTGRLSAARQKAAFAALDRLAKPARQ